MKTRWDDKDDPGNGVIEAVWTMLVIGTILLLFMACSGCSTTSTVTSYGADGKILKVEEVESDITEKLISSMKDKTIIIWKSGWVAYISVSPATLEDPTPTGKIFAGKVDSGYISIQKDMKDINWIGIAEAISATNKNLGVTTSGVAEQD